MLQESVLQQKLKILIKGKNDLVLFGNKSSGKTYLARKVLNQVIGQNCYISIKCIFVSQKSALMYLVGQEIMRVCRNLDSIYMMDQQKTKYDIKVSNQNNVGFQSFIKNVNKMMKNNQQFFKKVGRIYLFMDNIQDLTLNQQFFKEFYYGMKNQLKYVKISFFFCGTSMKSPLFSIYEPLRNIPYFFMPKPDIRSVVQNVIKQCSLYKAQIEKPEKGKIDPHFKKLFDHLKVTLLGSFDTIQFQIQRAYFITQNYVKHVEEFVARRPQNAKIWLEKGQNQQKQIILKLKQFGTTTQRVANDIVKKQIGRPQVGQQEPTFYMQNYPSLLATSLGLANGFPQSEDIKRFMDLKGHKTSRMKAGLKKTNAESTFKQDPKKLRHNLHRIISIAQVLQEQSAGSRFKQKGLTHHSMDYFGCIQYLREQGYINFYGKSSGKYGGTITGITKESEVRDFLKKSSLSYLQYTGKD